MPFLPPKVRPSSPPPAASAGRSGLYLLFAAIAEVLPVTIAFPHQEYECLLPRSNRAILPRPKRQRPALRVAWRDLYGSPDKCVHATPPGSSALHVRWPRLSAARSN